MTYELDLDLLRKKLSRARLQKETPKYLIKQPEGDLTESLSYLVENVMKPLLDGNNIHSADIDFNAFDDGDITDLLDYYMEHYYDGTSDWQLLSTVYNLCKKAVPLTSIVSFI